MARSRGLGDVYKRQVQVLDGQLGKEGSAVSQAAALLNGKAAGDLSRTEAIQLLGRQDTPGPLRELWYQLKAAAAAK
jgi:hypothetical protein